VERAPSRPGGLDRGSVRSRAIVADIRRSGYFWYVAKWARTGRVGTYGLPWVAALGNGGQRLLVFPTPVFVLAVTAGNDDTEDQWRPAIVDGES
jgi:hypothetical protein